MIFTSMLGNKHVKTTLLKVEAHVTKPVHPRLLIGDRTYIGTYNRNVQWGNVQSRRRNTFKRSKGIVTGNEGGEGLNGGAGLGRTKTTKGP